MYTFWLAAGVVRWGWKLPQRSGAVSCPDARSRTSVRELEGAPAGFILNIRMKQHPEKTNARSRTSVRDLEGAPAGFIANLPMKQQAEKQTQAAQFCVRRYFVLWAPKYGSHEPRFPQGTTPASVDTKKGEQQPQTDQNSTRDQKLQIVQSSSRETNARDVGVSVS